MLKIIDLLLLGYGAMGAALEHHWGNNCKITTIDPNNTHCLKGPEELPSSYNPDCIVFAVKPQSLAEIVPLYQKFCNQKCLFISVAAGIDLKFYQKILSEKAQIVRVMPNLPIMVGQGMTALFASDTVDQDNRDIAETLFNIAGKTVWLEDEALMDAVTAISGSGPAYFYWLVECLTIAGEKLGLPFDMAEKLARQTAVGAGAMLEQSSYSAATLRQQVTSPNGTTAAALDVLQTEFKASIEQATLAAFKRAKELAISVKK